MDIFLNLFRDEYESLEKNGVRNLDGSIYYYLDHVPWAVTFQSETLDGSSIKPLVEYITGKDLITGEKLTEYEKNAQLRRAGYNMGAVGIEAAIGGVFGVGAFAVVGAAAFAEINNITGAATYSVTKKIVQELGGSDKLAEKVGRGAEFLANSIGGKLIYDNVINPKVTINTAEAVIEGSKPTLSGQWKNVNESMSEFSKAYQKQITGQENMAWVQNGVKFDGMKDGVLLEAKGKYAQFINQDTGEFFNWYSGKQSFINQAMRQINASEGAKIQWYFAEEETLNAVQDLFMDEGITGIELIFEAPK